MEPLEVLKSTGKTSLGVFFLNQVNKQLTLKRYCHNILRTYHSLSNTINNVVVSLYWKWKG